ncbi:MAG: beta-ketoacyl synthase chain length factor, partial [Bacteroidia bacterium]|nr:beta-ketoacyl synthase chain length factor [Bacteroidia bacterium]
MAVYIQGVGIISPQKTLDGTFSNESKVNAIDNRFPCVEPDYSTFIDVKAIRRMSRIIRMGVTSSLIALRDSTIQKPDAIVVGTALGCLEDTVSFLNKLVANKEELLNPTAFIHSTHNTISSQIALNLQCRGYNSTYVHRNISFESAIIDSILLLQEGSVNTVLTGGIDELTETSYIILKRLGYYTPEIRAGEGSSFFLLSNRKSSNAYSEIKAVETISFCSVDDVEGKMKEVLKAHGLEKVDLILSGSEVESENEFSHVYAKFCSARNVLPFKELCGEYATSCAFATYLASVVLKDQKLPLAIADKGAGISIFKHIL